MSHDLISVTSFISSLLPGFESTKLVILRTPGSSKRLQVGERLLMTPNGNVLVSKI